jgi:hypothetical protein
MKKLIILAVLLVQSIATAKKVKDLEVQCSMQAKVADVSDISYSKGMPAQGRFPGIAPSISFKTSLEIISQSEGCEVLQSKYKIHFGGHLWGSGSIGMASEEQVSEAVALKNQVVELKVSQTFDYDINGNLPLFPTVHSESLALIFRAGNIGGGVSLPFNVNWVYGITPVEDFSDIEKLAFAEKMSYLAFNYGFTQLFLKLEPKQEILKKAYAQMIWKIFKQPKANDYLDFHVGGNGSFTGEPLAKKLNQISHYPGLFSSKEIVQLLTEFPTWLLAGNAGKDCLNFTAIELEEVLENAKLSFPVMTDSELWMWKDPLKHIGGPMKFVTQCTDGKVSDYAKALATELLKK